MEYKGLNEENIIEAAKLYRDTFNGEPWNDSWTIETAKERIMDIFDARTAYAMTVYENNELVGFILGKKEAYFDNIIFEIKEFCVKPTLQGLGIGKTILKEFEKRLKDKGIGTVSLITCRGIRTEGFYEKNGYKTSKEMIFMTKEI